MKFLKLPSGEYINLALVQRVEVEDPKILIHWQGGGKTYYSGVDAQAIVAAMNKLLTTSSQNQVWITTI